MDAAQSWDVYWESNNTGGKLYALVATFYRKFIIRPNLSRTIGKYFPKGTELLHAGCGSGEVDESLRDNYSLIGLDLSAVALRRYQKNVPTGKTVKASIFEMPFEPGSIQGIYNLGVMEHFTEEDIGKILNEFRRVLKPGGKAVLFWPPEFGLSVLFFKTLCKIYLTFTGKTIRFHPDEISRIRSKRHAFDLVERNGFKVVEYSFGPRDAFTYAVLTIEAV